MKSSNRQGWQGVVQRIVQTIVQRVVQGVVQGVLPGALAAIGLRFAALSLGLTLTLAGTAAFAQNTLIGFVKSASPDATVIVDGKSTRAVAGMPLHTGFVAKTGAQGFLGLTLRDNTLLSFGPNSEFVVDEYLYAPSRGDLKLSGTLLRGSLQYVSGIIAKLKPEAVAIRFPGGVVGVRGTEFLLLVDQDNS